MELLRHCEALNPNRVLEDEWEAEHLPQTKGPIHRQVEVEVEVEDLNEMEVEVEAEDLNEMEVQVEEMVVVEEMAVEVVEEKKVE